MLKVHDLEGLAPHSSHFAHGVGVPANARWCVTAGQIGVPKDGKIPPSTKEQARICFERIGQILAAEGMGFQDVVRLNAFIVNDNAGDSYRTVRDEFMGNHKPANTVIFIKALARPELLIEIEALAAKAD